MFAALQAAIPSDWLTTTAGVVSAEGKRLIEHIVLSPEFAITEPPTVFDRFEHAGKELSDHVGVGVMLATPNTMGKTR